MNPSTKAKAVTQVMLLTGASFFAVTCWTRIAEHGMTAGAILCGVASIGLAVSAIARHGRS